MALRLTSPCLASGSRDRPRFGMAVMPRAPLVWGGTSTPPLSRGGPRGKRLLGVFVGSRYRPWEGPKG